MTGVVQQLLVAAVDLHRAVVVDPDKKQGNTLTILSHESASDTLMAPLVATGRYSLNSAGSSSSEYRRSEKYTLLIRQLA